MASYENLLPDKLVDSANALQEENDDLNDYKDYARKQVNAQADPLSLQILPGKGGVHNLDKGDENQDDKDEEIQNLRRRLVEAERSRQETVQMAAVQTRTAQLSQQSNARTAQEAQALAEQLQNAMAQIQDLQKRVPAQ